MSEVYTGAVYYADGWHQTDEDPPRRLFLEDDGTYRIAEDGDESWHDRKHERFATFEFEDGAAATRVSERELGAINELLARMRVGTE